MRLSTRLPTCIGLCLLVGVLALLPWMSRADPVVLSWEPGKGVVTGWKVYVKSGCAEAPDLLTPVPLPATQRTFPMEVPLPTQDCWAVTALDATGGETPSNTVAAFATEAASLRLDVVNPPTLAWDPYQGGPEPTTGWKVYRQPRCTGAPTLLTKKPLSAGTLRYVDTRVLPEAPAVMCWIVAAVQAGGRAAPYTLVVTLPPRPSNLQVVTDGQVQETIAPVP
jgi:hypothetical protein